MFHMKQYRSRAVYEFLVNLAMGIVAIVLIPAAVFLLASFITGEF